MIIELIEGVALLLALCFLQSILSRYVPLTRLTGQVFSGVLFGGICVIGMLTPIEPIPGVIFDARSVILSMAGLFGGPVVGAIAGAIAGAYRAWLGGGGAFVGVGVIVTCVVLGLLYRCGRTRYGLGFGVVQFLVFGLVVQAACVAWFLLLPSQVVTAVLTNIVPPFMATFVPATAILGLLLTDIDRRIETDRELVLSRERFRALYNQSPVMMHSIDGQGLMVSVNDYWLSRLGYDRDDVVDRRMVDFLTPASREQAKHALPRFFPEGQVRDLPCQFVARDGQCVEVLLSATAEYAADGAFVRSLAVSVDVTEKNANQRALQASEARYRNIFETSEVAIFEEDFSAVWQELVQLRNAGVTDLRAWLAADSARIPRFAGLVRVVDANEAAMTMMGVSSHGVLPIAIDRLFPEGGETIFVDELCAIWERRKFFRAETEQRTLSGGVVDAIISLPVPDSLEAARHIPVIVVDVTWAKETEAALRQSQKMEALGQLTGGVAHDFNNLLAVMLGNVELLQSRYGDDPDLMRLLDPLMRAATRGAGLTQRLLAFAHTQPLTPKPIHVGDLLYDLHDMLRRTLGERVAIELSIADDVWPVLADPNQLEHSLVNLAVNARDAMPDGGQLVVAAENADSMWLPSSGRSTLAPGEYVRISVQDNGIGMSPEIAERVFEPFFTTKEIGQGSGLGLSMVYGFARQSNGHVIVESRPGKGTLVTIYLPRSTGTPAVAGALPAVSVQPSGGERILVVEDELEVRRVAVMMLDAAGYRVTEAAGADEALRILRTDGPFDMLFTDVVLCGQTDGVKLAELAQEVQSGLPVVYATGYSPRRLDSFAGDHGRDAIVIGKPYARDALLATLRDVLDTVPG